MRVIVAYIKLLSFASVVFNDDVPISTRSSYFYVYSIVIPLRGWKKTAATKYLFSSSHVEVLFCHSEFYSCNVMITVEHQNTLPCCLLFHFSFKTLRIWRILLLKASMCFLLANFKLCILGA